VNHVEIKIPSDPKFLKIVRSGIEHLCDVCGFPDETRHAIKLAVDEATTNIIKHAYQKEADKPIIIHCTILEDRLEIVLKDFGKKARPGEIKSRELEDVKPGGLGVHLIKTAMDVVTYDHSSPESNQLTLVKYLPGNKEP
jgi:anti-sigma regulatory factor (Ser/Thr protein kinase)